MSDIKTWISDWFNERANGSTLSVEQNFFEAGAIDSFGVIELIEILEEEFDFQFTEADFQDRRFSSIEGLASIIQEKKHGKVDLH